RRKAAHCLEVEVAGSPETECRPGGLQAQPRTQVAFGLHVAEVALVAALGESVRERDSLTLRAPVGQRAGEDHQSHRAAPPLTTSRLMACAAGPRRRPARPHTATSARYATASTTPPAATRTSGPNPAATRLTSTHERTPASTAHSSSRPSARPSCKCRQGMPVPRELRHRVPT